MPLPRSDLTMANMSSNPAGEDDGSDVSGHRCDFRREYPDGVVIFKCDRRDTELVTLHDCGKAYICPQHRSWLPSLGLSN